MSGCQVSGGYFLVVELAREQSVTLFSIGRYCKQTCLLLIFVASNKIVFF